MKKMVMAAFLMFVGFAIFAGEKEVHLFNAYTGLQEALAQDNYEMAKKHLDQLNKVMLALHKAPFAGDLKLAWQDNHAAMMKAQSEANKAQEIEGLRQAFSGITQAIIPLVKASRADHGLNVFHCPRAFNNNGAFWAQHGETVSNPYLGRGMLHCGKKVSDER